MMYPVMTSKGIVARKTKPRRVCDLRYKGMCGDDDLHYAIDRYYAKWGKWPDVVRVAPAMKAKLRGAAARMVMDGDRPPGQTLHAFGVKVTL